MLDLMQNVLCLQAQISPLTVFWVGGGSGLHGASVVLMMLSCYALAFSLLYFVRRRRDVPFRRLWMLFALLLLASGTTHLLTLWGAGASVHLFVEVIKVADAIIAGFAVCALFSEVPKVLALPSPTVLLQLNQQLEIELDECKRAEVQRLQRDTRDRQLLEARLRSSEQQMRAVFDAMNDVVLMCKLKDGKITDIEIAPTDPPIYEDFECDPVTQTVQSLWDGDENDWIVQVQKVLTTGQSVDFEYSLQVDDRQLWFTASVSLMSDSTVLWVARDICDRKQAEDDLRQSEARYRTIYDNTPVMLHSIDTQGELISVSNYWLDKMGYQRQEVLGRRSIEFLTPESRQQARERFLPQLYEQGFMQKVPCQFVTQAGEVMDVLLSAIADKDIYGETERFLAVIIDVTELKQVEQQLQQANAELTRSNRELEQFAYVASHDLKEPLRMVTSFTQLLAQSYSGQLDENADRMIAFAVDGATRMQKLIDDLLAYSRVGTQRNTLLPLDCGLVLEAAKANLQMAIAESQAVIHQGSLPTLVSDRLRLQQLWQNLLGNAIKYRSDSPPQIEVGAEEQKDHWLFFVRDNGIGMEADNAERIFMIFQRLHTKQEYPGTGIGLAICSKIVEQLGGKIWVVSELGEGSTFYFTLPK